ncbi:MAG: xylulokinase [Negativicutes bacterium]
MAYLLGIDIGTSAAKTVLFDMAGCIIASDSVEYPLYQPRNGWAEQEPDDWWSAVLQGINTVLAKSGIDSSKIKGIGLSGQMHGLVMLDQEGKPLGRSIIWCDQRTADECIDITEKVGAQRLVEVTANPALTGFTASKILWVRKHSPEVFAKCRRILLPKDYIRYKLAEVFETEMSDASGTGLLDVPNRCWSEEVLSKLEIPRELLPGVHESPEVTGYISREAARLTGLAAGTPVVGGAGDNAAAAVGTGVVVDGKVFTTVGTSGVVFAHTSSLHIDLAGRVHTFCCAVPGHWHIMGVTQAAGLSLKWFRDNFCREEIAVAAGMGVDAYSLMDQQAARIPIGSNKLIYLPYLMGERTPHLDPDCRGVFFGLSAMHAKADMVRAIMEGVAFSLRDSLRILKSMGVSPQSMILCGGGSMSPFWRQMFADIYGCEVRTVSSKEDAALGAAILAAVGVGLYSGVERACQNIIRTSSAEMPNTANSILYEKTYEVYRRLYPSIRENFKMLARI